MSLEVKRSQHIKNDHNFQQSPYFTKINQNQVVESRTFSKAFNKISQADESPALQGSRRSNSKAKSEFNYSRSGNSAYTASIKHRIEKACTTHSTADLRKQNMLLNRQIQKLQKQILRKDQQLLEMRTHTMPNKQVKTQLFQLYKALNFYEGKVKEMESQIYKFRDMILKASNQGVTADNLNILFEDLRRDNQQLSAQIEQTQYLKSSMQSNYNRLKTKYFESQRQLAEYKRKQHSPLHQYYKSNGITGNSFHNQKFSKYMNQLASKSIPNSMVIKQKQIIVRQLEEKNKEMQKQVEMIHLEMEKLNQEHQKAKLQNEQLKNQLEQKNHQITQLFKQFMGVKKSLKKIQSSKSLLPQSQNTNPQMSSWTPQFKPQQSQTSISKQ